MRRSSPLPLIIVISLSLYRRLLRIGPVDYREKYEEATLQVFCQCCRDAYQQGGIFGVLSLWLPMFYEALSGMIAERFSVERMRQMLPRLRRSIIITSGAFLVFGLAYLFLLRIIDPLPPFEVVGRLHPEIALAYSLIRGSADLVFLIVVVSGLVLLGIALKRAVSAGRRDVLARAGGAALLLSVFAGGTAILFGLPRPLVIHPVTQFAYLLFALLCLVGFAILIVQVVLRGEWGAGVARFVLACMALITLAMAVALVATVVWIVRLWLAAPQFAASQGLGPAGLLGNLGGSMGVAIVIVMMLATTTGVLSALWRALRAHLLPSA